VIGVIAAVNQDGFSIRRAVIPALIGASAGGILAITGVYITRRLATPSAARPLGVFGLFGLAASVVPARPAYSGG
jgi:hypothetical protein